MASPFAAYGAAFFSVEYRVNGLWNTLISQQFQQGFGAGDYIISPEAYPRPELTSGLRADLLVSNLVVNGGVTTISPPQLLYEGKGANGDDFDAMEEQLQDWLQIAAELAPGDYWIIGARGAHVKFWHWTRPIQGHAMEHSTTTT